jgi:hypothetical protein
MIRKTNRQMDGKTNKWTDIQADERQETD